LQALDKARHLGRPTPFRMDLGRRHTLNGAARVGLRTSLDARHEIRRRGPICHCVRSGAHALAAQNEAAGFIPTIRRTVKVEETRVVPANAEPQFQHRWRTGPRAVSRCKGVPAMGDMGAVLSLRWLSNSNSGHYFEGKA